MYKRSGEGTRGSRVASAPSEKWDAMLIIRACFRESYVQILPPELVYAHSHCLQNVEKDILPSRMNLYEATKTPKDTH